MSFTDNPTPKLKNPHVLFLSLFGVGFCPWAPGTVASLVSLPLFFVLSKLNIPFIFFLPPIILLSVASSFSANWAQNYYKSFDPSWIVIDEFLGLFVAFLFLLNDHFIHLFILFGLFRFFDIFKIWPIYLIDQKIKHGAGVILDDLLAGVFAGIVYRLICYWHLIPKLS